MPIQISDNAVSQLLAADVRRVKVDTVSSKLTYVGTSSVDAASTADPVWRIRRETVNGPETDVRWANGGAADQVWDDRASLFPPATFDNEYSGQFDGINDSVNFGNNLAYGTGSQWSWGFWVKGNNFAAVRAIFAKMTSDANSYGHRVVVMTTGQLRVQLRGPGGLATVDSVSTLTASTWQHVMVTYSGSGNISGLKMYINAVVDTATPSGVIGDMTNASSAYVGISNTSWPWSGMIDEATFWNKQLSLAEVQELYNGGVVLNANLHSAVANLEHYYRMGDGDTTPTVMDNAGAVNGTLTNGAAFVADTP